MAKTVASKNVVIPVESAEAVKANLRQVADEIARLRDRAKEEADSLERVRGMLDLRYLNDLLSAIEQLEERVKQMESGAASRRLQSDHDKEQERLAKLWDAFKSQEDQLRALEAERDDVIGRYKSMEKQYGDLGTPTQIRSRMSKLERDHTLREAELTSTTGRLEKYVALFTQEQERLAKLYKVYEDTAAQLAALQKKEARSRPAATLAASRGPFTFKGWTLYSRASKSGRGARTIYFFSKKTPKSGKPSKMPRGYKVRGGRLPVLAKS